MPCVLSRWCDIKCAIHYRLRCCKSTHVVDPAPHFHAAFHATQDLSVDAHVLDLFPQFQPAGVMLTDSYFPIWKNSGGNQTFVDWIGMLYFSTENGWKHLEGASKMSVNYRRGLIAHT